MNEPQRTEVSPLQEIERRVQLRAKETSLDMAGDGGRAKLRALIAQEVAAWSDGYKRGLRAFDLADPDVVAERAFRNLAGYGPLEPLLADDDVWEIMVNAPDQLFVKRHRGTSGYHDEAFILLTAPTGPDSETARVISHTRDSCSLSCSWTTCSFLRPI